MLPNNALLPDLFLIFSDDIFIAFFKEILKVNLCILFSNYRCYLHIVICVVYLSAFLICQHYIIFIWLSGFGHRFLENKKCLYDCLLVNILPCLTLSPGSAVYNLYAVSNHSGTTMGGHYTAYCCNPDSGEWYTFNDSRYSSHMHKRN